MPFYPGPGASIQVQEGATVVSPASVINFVGGTLTNSGGGEATYTPPGSAGLSGEYNVVSGRSVNTAYTNNYGVFCISTISISCGTNNYNLTIKVTPSGSSTPIEVDQRAGVSSGFSADVGFIVFLNPGDSVEIFTNGGSGSVNLWTDWYA